MNNPNQSLSQQTLSGEVQELIHYKPHWIIRQGNSILLSIFIVLVGLAWFVRYPDMVRGPVRILASKTPKLVKAKVEASLEHLLVSDEQQVVAGQHLAYMHSTASHKAILTLNSWIENIEPFVTGGNFEIESVSPIPILNDLGDVQPSYEIFYSSLGEIRQIFTKGYYPDKKNSILKDINYLQQVQLNTLKQKKLVHEEYELQKIEFKAKESLVKEKVIAPLEFNQDKSKLLTKQKSKELIDAEIISNQFDLHNKQKELIELDKVISDQKNNFIFLLSNLKNNVAQWIQKYIIVSPESGKVLFAGSLQANQWITPEMEMFYIQALQDDFYGELMASQKGLGKIKVGQSVIIKAEGYPSTEFGYLNGKVEHISSIPTASDSFLIRIHLIKGLVTNYNKTLHFRNNLLANADVITDNRRLLYRFLGKLNDILT